MEGIEKIRDNSQTYYILLDRVQIVLFLGLGLFVFLIGFIFYLLTNLFFELMIGIIVGLIVCSIGIRNEFFATPKKVIITNNGIINYHRFGGVKTVSWSQMSNIWLFSGQRKWRGIKRKDSSLFLKNRSLPIFLSYEIGLAIVNGYQKETGMPLPTTIMN